MTLLGPGFLIAGVLATAVPIAIFLLWRQRRRPVPFAAMRFLLEAERRHHRRLRLEKWLLLAIRCLALIVLGAALARPLLESGGLLEGGRRTVLLVIDDGMTAGLRERGGGTAAIGRAEGAGANGVAGGDGGPEGTPTVDARGSRADGAASAGTVLGRHVALAEQLIAGLEPGDRVGVVTAARGRDDLLPPSADLEAVVRWLEGLEPAAVPADLAGAIRTAGEAARAAVAAGEDPSIHVLSELRAGSADLQEQLPDLGLPAAVPLVASDPAADIRSNVAVIAIDPVRSVILPGAADGSGQLSVRLRRHGRLDAAESTVRVEVPGLPVIEPRTVRWSPGQADASVDVRLPVDPGEARALPVTARVDGDDLPVDDARAVILEARPSLRVALLDRREFGRESAIDRIGAGGWYERALQPGEGASLDVVRIEPAAVTEPDLRAVEAAVVPRPDLLRPEGWDRLAAFAGRGGLVIVSPPEDTTVHRWADELQRTFGLAWQVDRSTEVLDEPVGIAPPRSVSPLLTLLAGELEDLLRPVLVDRRLRIEPGPRTEVILAMEDGVPWLLSAWVAAEAAGRRATLAGAGADAGAAVRLSDPVAAGRGAEAAGAPGAPGAGDGAAGDAADGSDDAPRGGLLVALAVAPMLEWTGLPTKPLMVPLVQEIVRQGVGLARREARSEVGDRPRLVRFPAADRLVGPGGAAVPVGTDGRPVEPLPAPGVFTVADAGGTEIGSLAVTVEPAGGRTEAQPPDAVASWLAAAGSWTTLDAGDPGAALRRGGAGTGLARPLLILLAVLLVLETLLARRFAHVVRGRGPGGTAEGSILPTLALRAGGGRSGAADVAGSLGSSAAVRGEAAG